MVWVAVILLTFPVLADQVAPPTVDVQLVKSDGLFGKVLDGLIASHAQQQPGLTQFIDELKQYRKHDLEHRHQRIEALAKALDKVVEHSQDGDLLEAMVFAIEAHSQSQDPAALLTDPRITDLIQKTKLAAESAAADRDWLEVLSLYRRLNMLFEPRSPYREQLEMAEQRVRILATYAPKRLQELHLDRLKRLGKPQPKQIVEQFDSWELHLKEITISMLNDVFADSARHVTSPRIKQLLLGALDQILLLTQLPDLAKTFKHFDDPERVAVFTEFIQKLRKEISTRRAIMNRRYARNIVRRILNHNKRTIKLPQQVLLYELGEGVINTLDKFSEVIWPYKLEQFERTTQGNFTGVGIKIELSKDRRIRVVTPMPKTPAQRKGIRPNDYIVEVDGQSTEYWSLDKAVRKITGPRGTRVELGIERKDHDGILRFQITRTRIPIKSVWGWEYSSSKGDWNYYIDRTSKIGYIRLLQFIPSTADDLDVAIKSMIDDNGLNALILDLRGNPGGLLQQSIEVSNRFIPSGTIVSTVGADDIRTSTYKAKPHKTQPKMEVAVLVNRTSASASEIVAGALQDYGKAVIIGTRTYGKGSVQDLYPLAGDKAVLRLTTQYYKLPAGRIIHREPDDLEWGVDPDVVVPTTDQQVVDLLALRQEIDVLPETDQQLIKGKPLLDQGKDPQLATAVLMLKSRLLQEQIRLALGDKEFSTP
jgi:carboxyl-terminal processing protease